MAELERERTKRQLNHYGGSLRWLWFTSDSHEVLAILRDQILGLGRGMRKEKDEREKRTRERKERINGSND